MSDKTLGIIIFIMLLIIGLSAWGGSNNSSPSDSFDDREQVYTL